ncbi:MAG: hypothetical protein D3916_13100 [Candidatus Electrothrix sp. MAN1_4]|nr:hypothetical protein [Candidatus Electrothrix sp. MAN1_4]
MDVNEELVAPQHEIVEREFLERTCNDLSISSIPIEDELIAILEARLQEAQNCVIHSPLATIFLCGSLLEGILHGIARQQPRDFNQAENSPKDKNGRVKPFHEWSLAQFIDVAHGLGLLKLDVKKFSHILRDFRNYIHPYQQMRENFSPDRHTAEICLQVLKTAITNLTQDKKTPRKQDLSSWQEHPYATDISLLLLVGAWNEKNEADVSIINKITGQEYAVLAPKIQDLLQVTGSPLSLHNGIWKISERIELWEQLGSRIFDQHLEVFKECAVSVLTECDPAFELPKEDRFAASIYGKTSQWSPALRKGLAEGLALLGSHPKILSNCSQDKAEITAVLAIGDIFANSDWVLWGSLNNLLPVLAEAAPDKFLNAVENALQASPCPFDELFAQEGSGGFGGTNYMTGLLWALETLAWDADYLIRVCILLGELAIRDPGGNWGNRPDNSLITILLPWHPQTLAPIEKRKIVITTLCNELPDIGWKLLLALLDNRQQMTSGSHQGKRIKNTMQ